MRCNPAPQMGEIPFCVLCVYAKQVKRRAHCATFVENVTLLCVFSVGWLWVARSDHSLRIAPPALYMMRVGSLEWGGHRWTRAHAKTCVDSLLYMLLRNKKKGVCTLPDFTRIQRENGRNFVRRGVAVMCERGELLCVCVSVCMLRMWGRFVRAECVDHSLKDGGIRFSSRRQRILLYLCGRRSARLVQTCVWKFQQPLERLYMYQYSQRLYLLNGKLFPKFHAAKHTMSNTKHNGFQQ